MKPLQRFSSSVCLALGMVVANTGCEPSRDSTTTPTIPADPAEPKIDINIGGGDGVDVEVRKDAPASVDVDVTPE